MAANRLEADLDRTQDDLGRVGGDARRLIDRGREALPGFARQASDRARDLFEEQVDRLRAQGGDFADLAGENLENARVYVVERVQERPLTATLAALGVGFLFGVLLAGSRR